MKEEKEKPSTASGIISLVSLGILGWVIYILVTL